MKRLFGLLCVVVLLLTAVCIPAYGAAYSRTIACEFVNDYSYNVGNSAGYVKFDYVTSFLGIPDTIMTQAYVPTGGTGRTFSFITRQFRSELEAYSSQDTTISNNQLVCSVSLRNYLQATKANHFAIRSYNGTSDSWDYYYVSSLHGQGVDYDSLSVPARQSLTADSK